MEPTTAGARRVDLRRGRALVVRPVGPDDVDALVALYDGLSDDDRYRRFFSAYRPDRGFFERAASVRRRGGYGLVAVEVATARERELRLVGEAAYELLPNGDGELAMAVASDWRGWLGPYLLDALVDAAAERGVPNLEADVLATNAPMLALLRSRGYANLSSDDWVSLRLIVGTRGRTPVWPRGAVHGGGPPGPRVLVEAPGGRWHAAREAADAGFDVITCSGPRGGRCPALAGEPCPLVEGADAVVVSRPRDDERWRSLVDAHARAHPAVPVCVEPRPGSGADDPRLVVSIIDRVTAAVRRRDVGTLASGQAAPRARELSVETSAETEGPREEPSGQPPE
ncbi:MAG TPA: GNAT family N-acetyltransferase [Acidimicrobiales bacterium]